MPMDIPERPNTRRSHLRSRGGPSEPVDVGLGPGMELDAIPPTLDTAPEMPVRRPEQPPITQTGTAENSSPNNASVVEVPTAGLSLLVISQKKSINTKDGGVVSAEPSPRVAVGAEPVVQQVPTQTPLEAAIVVAVAPEAPRSSAPSSSGAVGGRRGRNISNAASSVSGSGSVSGAVPGTADGTEGCALAVNPSALISRPIGNAPTARVSTGGSAGAKVNPSPRAASAVLKSVGGPTVGAKPPLLKQITQ